MPHWTGEGLRALSPQLTGWVLYGASVAFVIRVLRDLMPPAVRRPGIAPTRIMPNKHVVILGGGFGGMNTAKSLEHLFGADPSVDPLLVLFVFCSVSFVFFLFSWNKSFTFQVINIERAERQPVEFCD
jgi:hypothetical protein